MNTAVIESTADFERCAAPNFPKGVYLRRKVIPEFFTRVGLVGWRKLIEVVQVVADDRAVNISEHYATIDAVWRNQCNPLTFIGDSKFKMMRAAANTTPAAPSEYFLSFNAAPVYDAPVVDPGDSVGPTNVRSLNLGAPSDGTYDLTVFGWKTPYFDDDTTDVDMNPFIPFQFHWGLVEGLKAEIYRDRYGVDDKRSVDARQSFLDYINQASEYKETTIEETPRYA